MFSALALNGLDARALVDELRARMREELDYRLEAREHRRVRRPLRRPPVGAHPRRWCPSCRPAQRADDRVGRRADVGPVRRHRVAGDQAARRRGDLALRPALGPPPRRVQRRPAPGQLPLPPRRQRDVPRLRARQAVGRRRVGAPRAEPRRHRRRTATRTRSSTAMETRRLPRRRPRARPAARLRLRVAARTGRTSSTSSRSPGTGCATRSAGSSTSTARTPT